LKINQIDNEIQKAKEDYKIKENHAADSYRKQMKNIDYSVPRMRKWYSVAPSIHSLHGSSVAPDMYELSLSP